MGASDSVMDGGGGSCWCCLAPVGGGPGGGRGGWGRQGRSLVVGGTFGADRVRCGCEVGSCGIGTGIVCSSQEPGDRNLFITVHTALTLFWFKMVGSCVRLFFEQ